MTLGPDVARANLSGQESEHFGLIRTLNEVHFYTGEFLFFATRFCILVLSSLAA
jgi:hypothetical protein